MAEQLADRLQVCAARQELGGEAVSEAMGSAALVGIDFGGVEQLAHDFVKPGSAPPTAAALQNPGRERLLLAMLSQRGDESVRERHCPLLVGLRREPGLGRDVQLALDPVDVVPRQVPQLIEPQTRIGAEQHECPLPCLGRGVEQRLQLVLLERLTRALAGARKINLGRPIDPPPLRGEP